jgi:hypothetical protein
LKQIVLDRPERRQEGSRLRANLHARRSLAAMETVREKPAGDHVLKTPLWMVIIRAFQILIAFIILAMAARLMHDAYLDEQGLALAIVSRSRLSPSA